MYHVINVLTFLAIVRLPMLDIIMVLNKFSNYWHRETDNNQKRYKIDYVVHK
jgi:hypothetical protein